MNKAVWNGVLSKAAPAAEKMSNVFNGGGGHYQVMACDGIDPTPLAHQVSAATVKLDKLARFVIETGRISVAKAAEVMGVTEDAITTNLKHPCLRSPDKECTDKAAHGHHCLSCPHPYSEDFP